MSPPTLLFIRHGQTSWNVERRVLGRTDIPLDDVGRGQAAALAEVLGPLHALWSSPLGRARATAEAVAATHPELVVQVEPELTEMDQGELDGCAEAELRERFGDVVRRWHTDPATERLPGGETMLEVQARGLAALARIARSAPPGARVAVVSHQLVISSVICALAAEPLTAWRRHSHRNTAWSELRWGEPPEIVSLRLAPHLPAPG